MVRKNNRRKEDICEDWCFICKDGGSVRVCDYKDCLKVYHPECVRKDDSFLETDENWTCVSHFCFMCNKESKFKCFCCPKAVCGHCFYLAEFAVVKGRKGFCSHCSKLAHLIEQKADVDSDGEEIDLTDPETYESYFLEYYERIKQKEGLTAAQVNSAYRLLKNGKNYKSDLDLAAIADDAGESEDGSNFAVSDYEDLNDTEAVKSVRKNKRKIKSVKRKSKYKKKEFIGWASKSLVEFLEYIGRDTSKEYSEHDVASFIIEYCKNNKLFDPKKKRKVLCDERLRSLLGRKSVNRNSLQNLLAAHFVDNLEDMEGDMTGTLEYTDDNEPLQCSSKKNSSTIPYQNPSSAERQSCFAAIVSPNLKLVYLKRSLVEDLLKQPETFDGKVMGSFVRVKSDPHDIFQKNTYMLSQVVGINRSSGNHEVNKEILLQLSNVLKDTPVSKISDDGFSEEECQDLYERMRKGLLKQPTILELEEKAKSLHEAIIKHWIPREIHLLQKRIDQANEKGWRRELAEYLDRKENLQSPLEQSRLLSDIPEVIPEILDSILSPEDSQNKDRFDQNGLHELGKRETSNFVGHYSKHSGVAYYLNHTTHAAGAKTTGKRDKGTLQRKVVESSAREMQDDPEATLSEELSSDSQTLNSAKFVRHQQRNTESGSGIDVRNLNAPRNAEQTESISAIKVGEQEVTISTADVIGSSGNNKQAANIADISAGRVVENQDLPIWHCVGPNGGRGGPFSMSVLKRWIETAAYPCLEFKVWKTYQNEAEAILLTDALRQIFPTK